MQREPPHPKQQQQQHHQFPRRTGSNSDRLAAPKKRSLLPRTKSRSSSFQGLTVHLSVLTVKTMLGRISPHCHVAEEQQTCNHIFSNWKEAQLSCAETLEQILFFMKDKLASQEIPNDLVADMHSCIGLIQDKLGHSPQQAIRSLMNALWIQEKLCSHDDKNTDYDEVIMALTEHRLALLYGKVGDYENAVSLMEKAYNQYGESKSLKTDHEVYIAAEESLGELRMKLLDQKLSNRSTHHSTSLSGIVEEEDSISTTSSPLSQKSVLVGAAS